MHPAGSTEVATGAGAESNLVKTTPCGRKAAVNP